MGKRNLWRRWHPQEDAHISGWVEKNFICIWRDPSRDSTDLSMLLPQVGADFPNPANPRPRGPCFWNRVAKLSSQLELCITATMIKNLPCTRLLDAFISSVQNADRRRQFPCPSSEDPWRGEVISTRPHSSEVAALRLEPGSADSRLGPSQSCCLTSPMSSSPN